MGSPFDDPEFTRLVNDAEQSMVPPDLKAQGWVYRDAPGKFSAGAWDQTMEIIGEKNCRILALSTGNDDRGVWKRGQILISPQGIENLNAWVKAKQERFRTEAKQDGCT